MWNLKRHAGIQAAELWGQGALQQRIDDPFWVLLKAREALRQEAVPIVWEELLDS